MHNHFSIHEAECKRQVRDEVNIRYDNIIKCKIYTAYNFINRIKMIHSYLNSTIIISFLIYSDRYNYLTKGFSNLDHNSPLYLFNSVMLFL